MKRTKLKNNFLKHKTEKNKRVPIKNDDNNNDSIHDPVIRTIVKYEVRPSIIVINENCASGTPFRIMSTGKEDLFLKKSKFANKKAAQTADITANLIKENLEKKIEN